MKKILSMILITMCCLSAAHAQEFIPLWEKDKMPNSKGMHLTDSITNERVWRVGIPGVYAFFPSKQENKGAAVVICPGGGYDHLAYVISGTQLAKWYNTMGINAFVLNYRLPTSPDLKDKSLCALQDGQRAIRLVRANAAKWGIKINKIGIMGLSSGGHVASSVGTHLKDASAVQDTLDKFAFRPDFIILVSPVISMGPYAHQGSLKNLLGPNATKEQMSRFSSELQVTPNTPPTFIADAVNDKTVNPMNSLLFYEALLTNKVSVSFHAFPQGGHAIGLRDNPGSTAMWTQLCEAWLYEINIIEPAKTK